MVVTQRTDNPPELYGGYFRVETSELQQMQKVPLSEPPLSD